MLSHSLHMRELQRQELLAEAARERLVEQLALPASSVVRPSQIGSGALVRLLFSTLARLRTATHGTDHAPAS